MVGGGPEGINRSRTGAVGTIPGTICFNCFKDVAVAGACLTHPIWIEGGAIAEVSSVTEVS